MDERTETRIQGWESKPLTGGFAELRELADGGFSGAARTATTTLFMLNGRVVGVFGGTIDEFDGTDATVYQAPHPSLPLLFAMQEYGGEQQAKNYTKDTPISAAHDQLQDAGFTGYIELSENVLSGDYYVVFYGGRAMSCAFVGNSGRLETGDDAFHLADDEVGIYEVRSVDIEVTDIPEGTGDAGAGASADPDPVGAGGDEPGGVGADEPATGGAGTQQSAGSPGGQQPASETAGQRSTGGATEDPSARSPTEAASPAEESTPGAGEVADEEPAGSAGQASGDPLAGGADLDAPSEPADPTGTTDQAGDQPAADPVGGQPGDREATEPRRTDAEPADRTGAGASTGSRGADAAASDAGVEPEAADAASEAREPDPTGATREEDRASTQSPDASAQSPDAGTQSPDGRARSPAAEAAADSGTDDGSGQPRDSGPAPREEAAADRAVEAASGPQGSAVTGAGTASEGVPKSQASLGELRVVPSLSPDRTRVAEPGEEAVTRADDGGTGTDQSSGGSTASRGASSAGTRSGDGAAAGGSRTSTGGSARRDRSGGGGGTDVTERASQAVDVDVETGGADPVPDSADAGELRRQLAAREERIEELETAITDLRVQRDGLTDERNRLESEVERLESEVADLEAQVERLEAELSDGTEGKQRLSREDALAGTNLFVRYASKSGGTLEKAHRGDVDREEVNENLRLEHHTQFEADDVVVEDRAFDQFLRRTVYREFVEWVVRELLYEIQETGHVKQLRELYDAIPKIDRAELLGDVSVEFTEDGEQYREQRSFDVVLRDRMGNPLIVANINDSRNPADREMMETVIGNGIDVKESNESLSSAMMVTSSFFKPGALEAADEAHGGSLLGRDSKDSYVKLNRKSGYHLILVESRDDDFHVNVPEL